ncbi:uncharacterized protein EAF02_005762 [Botrytis sinoallii]|uniref:uncharacterized protein n=1 Tax=Botrytis sinoallii TaxID=1463999 RepID=UPI0019023653|nr:uncharacterized protein EAF02_005762 [Botrytis sinoallii]KAF7882399.1 hypothetical protein EAF02_005762 [Botrytis sinoallii]
MAKRYFGIYKGKWYRPENYHPKVSATSEWRPVGSVDLFNTCSILSKASYIAIDEKSSWIPVSASTSSLIVNGAISLIPNATKHIQFLAFGIEPLISQDNCNFIYEEINRWFLNSSFGNQEEANELDEIELKRRSKDRRFKGDGYTNKELKAGKKSVDRWPMFYINVHQVDPLKHARLKVDDVLDEKRNTLDKILKFLHAIIVEFLTRNHFRPKLARGNRTKRSELATSTTNSEILEQSGPTKTNQSCQDMKTFPTTPGSSGDGDENNSQKRVRIDTLGTKVKLPSFRQSHSASDSPFGSWSKIKTGIEQPHRKFTDTPENFSIPVKVSSKVEVRAETALFSKSGQLTRCTFEESQAPISKATPFTDKVQESDEMEMNWLVWVNPVNKVKSLVNRRTGLVVSEKKEDGKHIKQFISNSSSRLTAVKKSLTSDKQPIPWIDDILNRWENPVFAPAQPSIPQVSMDGLDLETQEIIHGRHQHCSQAEIEKAFEDTSSGLHGRISKKALRDAEIISQVDKKFILANLQRRSIAGEDSTSLLVIIDQHAADERIRIETLLSDFLTSPTVSNIPASASVFTTPLEKSLNFNISTKDSQLFRTYMNHFCYWGIIYSVSPTGTTITVRYLPPLITARLVANPSLLLHILRTELYSYHENPTLHPTVTPASTWIERIAHIPKSVLELLNSRACRTAIMFNDELGVDECRELVRRLANCKFPFMCAHGRVSMVPLGELEMMTNVEEGGDCSHSVRSDQGNKTGSRHGTLGTKWGKWMSQRRKNSKKEQLKQDENLKCSRYNNNRITIITKIATTTATATATTKPPKFLVQQNGKSGAPFRFRERRRASQSQTWWTNKSLSDYPLMRFASPAQFWKKFVEEPNSKKACGVPEEPFPDIELDFTDDNPEALLILLRIAHLKFSKIPSQLPYEVLYNIAVICDQYDYRSLVKPWIQGWLKDEANEAYLPHREGWLWIAYYFGRKEKFYHMMKILALQLTIGDDGRCVMGNPPFYTEPYPLDLEGSPLPLEITDTIIRLRKDMIYSLTTFTADIMKGLLNGNVNSPCKELCPLAMYGLMSKHLGE